MKRWVVRGVRAFTVGICAGLLVAGCGSDSTPAAQQPPAGGGNSGGDGGGGECPLTVEELKSATSETWTEATVRKDHPLVLQESVKVTACVYTADELKQQYGDPLVVRVDVVAPKDAEQVRERFRESCTRYRGTELAAGGGTVCERSGMTLEGVIGNLNVVTMLNADKDTATRFSPSFEKILAAAG